MTPDPGAWSFGSALSGTSLHIEHIEEHDDGGPVTAYWHNQRLVIGELSVSASHGIAPHIGVGAMVPLRWVRDRIKFEDLERQPFRPHDPDTHHRNETRTRLADPQLAALFGGRAGAWTLNGGVGTTVPLGKTEDNPFERGRLGLPHQHIQFGTGTFDPIANVFAARSVGVYGVQASAAAKVTLYENSHGFRAGNRYDFTLGGSRSLGTVWGATAGLRLDREEAEKWDGRIEYEGNLGRTDLFARFGVTRAMGAGVSSLSVQVPVESWVRGEQVEFPIVVSLSWSR